jgi:endonuclease/exonuclease/phosphatase family metal-dependent hydrolase
MFMQEIEVIKQAASDRWLLMGDFNLIYRACDKSNGRINRGLMNSFRRMLDDIEMKEIHLHGRRFTWTSETQSPTQTKIDHVFANKEWELLYPNCHLQATGTLVSDHCPMILTVSLSYRRYKGFHFESLMTERVERNKYRFYEFILP